MNPSLSPISPAFRTHPEPSPCLLYPLLSTGPGHCHLICLTAVTSLLLPSQFFLHTSARVTLLCAQSCYVSARTLQRAFHLTDIKKTVPHEWPPSCCDLASMLCTASLATSHEMAAMLALLLFLDYAKHAPALGSFHLLKLFLDIPHSFLHHWQISAQIPPFQGLSLATLFNMADHTIHPPIHASHLSHLQLTPSHFPTLCLYTMLSTAYYTMDLPYLFL